VSALQVDLMCLTVMSSGRMHCMYATVLTEKLARILDKRSLTRYVVIFLASRVHALTFQCSSRAHDHRVLCSDLMVLILTRETLFFLDST
jgi:hypothetical protein